MMSLDSTWFGILVALVCCAAYVLIAQRVLASRSATREPDVSVMITHLTSYPVKSCRGVELESSKLDALCGLEDDRRYMFVDRHGVFCSQRRFPALCKVAPQLCEGALSLKAPGMPLLTVPIVDDAKTWRPCRIWDDRVQGADQGDAAAAWISDYLKTEGCRLVRFPPDAPTRAVDPTYAPRGTATAFSDGFPLLVASAASLADLNARLAKRFASPVPMDRFRPNVVVAGAPAWAEDRWRVLRRGDGLRLEVVKPCSRCKIPNIDQDTGVSPGAGVDAADDLGGGPGGAEVTAALKVFRSGAALSHVAAHFAPPKRRGDVFFGQNLTHAAPGATLRVGDVMVAGTSKREGCAVS